MRKPHITLIRGEGGRYWACDGIVGCTPAVAYQAWRKYAIVRGWQVESTRKI